MSTEQVNMSIKAAEEIFRREKKRERKWIIKRHGEKLDDYLAEEKGE